MWQRDFSNLIIANAQCPRREGVGNQRKSGEQENQKYREEHSLFEDIVVGGRLMQETFLRRDEEGKWELYAAGDFSGRAYIYFTKAI